MKRWLKEVLYLAVVPVFFFAGVLVGAYVRLRPASGKPRLVWGSTPLINNRYWSRAMRAAGYPSETFTYNFYATINQRADWDRVLDEEWSLCPSMFKPMLAFLQSLIDYDVFFVSADGFFIGSSPGLWRLQGLLLRLGGKKVVFVPYGGDAYVYRRVRSTALLHGLLVSYPEAARKQDQIQAHLDYWCRYADACVSTVMGADGFGRWDVLVVSPLSLDLAEWCTSVRQSQADGRNGVVTICHAPNHRGFKGSEFLIEAVQRLQNEGLQVELLLLEKMQNTQVRHVLHESVDILVEQLIVTGHGLNGLEGLASGIPVISNLEDEQYLTPARRWSYFSECPIVSATPENIVDVLRKLVQCPDLRRQLGLAGRKYAEKYHGLDSAQYLFTNVIDYVYGRKESLINLYHPLLGEYKNRLPKIQHPLINNRIVD